MYINTIYRDGKPVAIAPTKAEMRKKSVAECLTMIYKDQCNPAAINDMSAEKLRAFVLEVFNKGLLNNYLDLK